MYITYRLRVRTDGLLMGRNLRSHQLQEVLTNFLGHLPALRAAAPPEGLALLALTSGKAQVLQDLLLAEVGPVHNNALPIPAELTQMLAELQRAVDLHDLVEVNRLLDALIIHMGNLIQIYAQSPERDEYALAAQRLEQLWFADGRDFLRANSARQWAETQRRLERPSAQTLEDLRLLRLHKAHARILAFNNWFARLQGIDPTRPIPEDLIQPAPEEASPQLSLREIELQAEAFMAQLLALGTALWPDPNDPAHNRARALLLGKLLDKIQERP